uniref:Uncharacterized protein n=1 Tax=Oryzias melastigma TaxID=30732 RepID=A0A3B3D9T6_ORYME
MCGIDGNFYKCIKALYKAPLACVQVNELRTGWFPTPFGVKQGDVLSPTLFVIYVNDLEETKLQKMLDIMNSWCTKWRLSINDDKTQIVHFRKPYVCQSDYQFDFGTTLLMYSVTYKYLGFVFHENMTFSEGRRC